MGKDSEYICTLDQASIKKAKDELNEIPEDRLSAVQAFREWIEAQPHIRCPKTDTIFLLRFLRWAKYSQVRAREKFENYLNAKKVVPKVFANLDATEASFVDMVKAGMGVPLPKPDKQGRTIIWATLNKNGMKSIDKHGPVSMYRNTIILLEYIAKNEHSQVDGIVIVNDASGLSPSFMKKFMTSEVAKAEEEFWKSFPGRFKKFHMYKIGVFFDVLISFFKPFVPKKVMDRAATHETMLSVYDEIPMECIPREYLPDDYDGPCVGTMDECIDQYIKGVQDKGFLEELKYRSSDAFGIDASKKPAEQVTQHFRKLNVD